MADFNPKRVSPSRIGTYADCGEAFRLKYVEGVAPERCGSAALFGKVMHKAREEWVLDRKLDLVKLTQQAWKHETQDDPVIAAFLDQYQRLSIKAIAVERQIFHDREAQGRPVKMVRMTKDWKESTIAKAIEALMREWLEPLNKGSKYEFTERDPLPSLYDESLVLARRYSIENQDLPTAYESEFPFEFEWNGYTLNGFIDEICPIIDPRTGIQRGVGVVDAKTYRNAPVHAGKDSRQLIIYSLALKHYYNAGVLDIPIDKYPIYQGIDRMRLLEWKWYQYTDSDEARLLRELQMYSRGIEAEVYIPASKTCNANYCDFAKHCIFYTHEGGHEVDIEIH